MKMRAGDNSQFSPNTVYPDNSHLCVGCITVFHRDFYLRRRKLYVKKMFPGPGIRTHVRIPMP